MANETPPGAEAIMRALDRQKARDREWEAHKQRSRRDSEISGAQRAEFLEHCQPATLLEYTAWMIGYLKRGGEPSGVYDYEFSRRGVVMNGGIGPDGSSLNARPADPKWWVLAAIPDRVPSLYGARSVNVIVPAELAFAPEDLPDTFHGRCGHSAFYFMDGFKVVGSSVPIYSDMLSVLAADL